MATITDFNYFDPEQEYVVTYGDLPHWEQAGATYFITFRTADSYPKSALELWRRERDEWLDRQTKDSSDLPWNEKLKTLPWKTQQEFNRLFRHKMETQLDECHGECLLRNLRHAQIVVDALHHFDGQRYSLGDFVVMPNHVHLLVCFYKEVRLRKQCYSWKHFMATEINKLRGKKGVFWQTESYDHLVRDLENFQHFQRYIEENPKKAKLMEGEYLHYQLN